MSAIVFCYPGIDREYNSINSINEYGYKIVNLTMSIANQPISSELVEYYDFLVVDIAQQGKTVLVDFDFSLMTWLYTLKRNEGLKTNEFTPSDIRLVAIYPDKSNIVGWRDYATKFLYEKGKIDSEDLNRIRHFYDEDMRQIDYYNKVYDGKFLDQQIVLLKDPIHYHIYSLLHFCNKKEKYIYEV